MQAWKCLKQHGIYFPLKVAELESTAADLDALFSLPFFKSIDITILKSELATFIAAVEDVTNSIDPLEWWKFNEAKLPNWAIFCK